MHHTNHGLHLYRKGKSCIADKIVKEIEDLYLPTRVLSPIILIWKNVNYDIFQMFQLNKGNVNGAPSVIVNNNGDCQISRNMDCQKIELSDEYVHEVLPVMTVEGLSPGSTLDYQECGSSVVGVDFPAESDMGGAAGASKGKVDFQEVDHAGKPARVNNELQNYATMRKYTRLKNLSNVKKQDFLW
jgi:hypothetical protein